MSITREQFIRGFNAIKAAQARREAVEAAAISAGFEDFSLGSNPLAHEMETLLGDLCRVREDEYGPWPEDCCGEDDLCLALHDMGAITDEQGRQIDFPKTAEGLWDMWEREKTGPFRPVRGQVISLDDHRRQP